MFVEKKGKTQSAFDAEKDMAAATPRRPPEALKDLGSYNFSGLCRHVMHTSCRPVWPPLLISAMPEIQDDKAQYCIPFILERLEVHRRQHEGEENAPPFFLGLNGVQGAGKTVLVIFSPSCDLFQPTHFI